MSFLRRCILAHAHRFLPIVRGRVEPFQTHSEGRMRTKRLLLFLTLIVFWLAFGILFVGSRSAMACAMCGMYKYVVHVNISPVLTAKQLESMKVDWAYSERYSRAIMDQYDQDGDGTLSESESLAAREGLWAQAQANRFYFTLAAEGESLPIQGGRHQVLTIKDDIVELSFEIRVTQPVKGHSVFRLFFSDDSGDIKFSMPETFGPPTSGPWRLTYSINWSELLTITVLHRALADAGSPASQTEPQPRVSKLPGDEAGLTDWTATPRKGLVGWLGGLLIRLKSVLTRNFRQLQSGFSLGPLLIVLMLSFLYGVAHNVGPGHGKTVLAVYLAVNPITLHRAVVMSLAMGAIHIFSGMSVGMGVYTVIRFVVHVSDVDVSRFMVRFSGVLIMGVAAYLLYMRTKGGSHDHHHHVDGPAGGKRADVLVVLAAGIVPCPGLVVVFLFCLALEMYLTAILAAMAMSLGAAAVMIATAVLTLTVRRGVSSRYTKFGVVASYVGPVVILGLGLILLLSDPDKILGPVGP